VLEAWDRREDRRVALKVLIQRLAGDEAFLERLERERAACGPGARAGEQQWEGRGVVRAAYPQLLVITHEEIRGLLPARTTSFRAASPTLGESIRIGDPIRFSLRGTLADDAAVVAVEQW